MHLFDRDTMLEQVTPFHYTGNLSANWLINGIANGGYIMAVIANAMLSLSDMDCTPILTANYIAPCYPGGTEVKLEEISRSSRLSRMQASLFQEGNEKIRAWGTFAGKTGGASLNRYESGPPGVAALDDCIVVPDMPSHSLLTNLDMRLDPSSAGWLRGELTERSEQKGWVSFRDKRPHDILSVFLIADAFPPPVFVSHGLLAWVPTIELSVNIRNIPVSDWLKFSLRSRFFTGNLVEEDGEVWDEENNLVAISRQIALVRINDS